MRINRIYTRMKVAVTSLRSLLFFIVFSLSTTLSWAQRPQLLSIDRTKGGSDQILTINGSQFGINAAALSVRFGAAKASITHVEDHLLQVKIPAGATFDNLSITKTAFGLTTYSREHFNLTFSGSPGFDLANMAPQQDFPTTPAMADGLSDLCMCDFDGDNKNDVAVVNDNSLYVMVYPNTSTGPGSISFGPRQSVNIFASTLHIRCADLNGDGKPDIIATNSNPGDKVITLRNTSTGPGVFTFNSTSWSTAGAKTKQVEVADLDLDGKPELIISSQATNTLKVLYNQSTTAAVNFNPPVSIPLPGLTNTDGLAVDDLNGDQLPEIVTAQYQAGSSLYLIKNTSTPGVLNLELTSTALSAGGTVKSIRIGDIDRDGKSDIIFTKQDAAQIGIFPNQSTSSAFSFGAAKFFSTDGIPYGIAFGDVDGDGLPDAVAASATKKSLTIFNNKSTPGSINMTGTFKSDLTYLSRHVQVGDVDTDGKPDIVFTSIDDKTLVIPASKVSVLRNKTCLIPVITPAGPLNVCNTFPQQLEATYANGVTYEWRNITTTATVSGTNVFTPVASGDHIVTATSEGGTCAEESNVVKVTISPGTAADPLPVYSPVCAGGTLAFSLNNNLGVGYTYNWTGPLGFSATGAAPSIANVTVAHSGEYFVETVAPGGCVARKQSLIVKVTDKPSFTITYPNSEIICSGLFKKLSVNPVSADYTYEWFEATAGALGVTTTTHDIATSGQYYVKATSTEGCGVIESSKAVMKVVPIPQPAFTLQESACKGQEVPFTDQSTGDATEQMFYVWSFGDGNTSNDKNPKHIYATTGTKSVTLTLSYKNNTCARTSPADPISITDAPSVLITTSSGATSICPQGSLQLSVSGTFNSYAWSTGASSSSIEISAAGTYSVNVVAPNGCELKAIKEIESYPEPVIQVSATPSTIEEGESSQLFAEGLQNYTWTPPGTLSAPFTQDPLATPLTTTEYTVTGFDSNNCIGEGSVIVTVKGDAIVDKLTPSNFFSPNADASNPFWLVGDISLYPQCGVTIYDDKGVKVFDAKPYLENWDGTRQGKVLPDGVYYYIIRCDGEENKPRMGSITILR